MPRKTPTTKGITLTGGKYVLVSAREREMNTLIVQIMCERLTELQLVGILEELELVWEQKGWPWTLKKKDGA